MQSCTIKKNIEVTKTPRLLQVSSLFDTTETNTRAVEWNIDIPDIEKDWNIGLILGESGSGKSTLINHLYPNQSNFTHTWNNDLSIVDNFPSSLSITEIIDILGSVGFNSPPHWISPYSVLSNGEKFRVEIALKIAMAIANNETLIIVDEFTSVVDRQVAKIASNSIQKSIRKYNLQLIACSCHFDIIEWIQPDWIYNVSNNNFIQNCLRRRPNLDIEVYSIDKKEWKHFKKYHYLSASIHSASKCFGGFIKDKCVAFTAYRIFPHPKVKDICQGHRLVVLPDYQGLGIGLALDNWLGSYLHQKGYRYHNVVVHPAMVHSYNKSEHWKLINSGYQSSGGRSSHKHLKKHQTKFSNKRYSYSFAYVP